MSKFYNESFKKEYLQSIEDNDILFNASKRIFESSYNLESELQSDLCEFNKFQMLKFLKSLSQEKVDLINTKIALSKYIHYCIENNTVSGNIIDEIDAGELKSLAK